MSLALTPQERRHMRTAAGIFGAIAILALILLVPMLARAQGSAVTDDLGQLLALVVGGIKGGDWQGAILAGILVAVWIVRALAKRIPKVGAFLGSDEGGALLLVLTGLPVALLAAKAGGASLTWGLTGKALIATLGAGGGWSVGRKLLRLLSPLIAKIPWGGKAAAALIDALSGANAKAEIAAQTAAAYKPLTPAPTAAEAAKILGAPPVP